VRMNLERCVWVMAVSIGISGGAFKVVAAPFFQDHALDYSTTKSTAAIALAGDPVVGTWKLNVSSSKFSPGPAPKEEMRVYDAQGDGIKVTVSTTEADGHSTTVRIAANYDGKDYPIAGSSDYDAIVLKKINEQTAEAALMHGQKVIATAKREISADGKTMTITYKTSQDQDRTTNNQAVYNKQ
jgi:hypothetical protein